MFAYPGDGINGLVAAFGKADDRPRFIQSRHEEMSALAAVGYAKFSGQVGVCMATSGPGAIHLLNGLYDAKLDHVPVVAIVGQTERSAMGGAYQQEVDLQALFKDVASDYLVEVNVPEQLPNAIDRAFRTALTRRAPTAIIVPSDLQTEDYSPPEHAFKQVPSSEPGLVPPTVVADEAEIVRAAEVLNAGSKVAILVGQGARGAAAEVIQVAEVLGAGVAKALLGKDVLSDELPFVTGAIGLLGTRPSYELMMDCDTLLIVGSNFPYSQFLPEFGKARAVQIDLDGHPDRDALPDRGQPGRRRRGHPAGAAAAAVRLDRPGLAGDDRAERQPLVGRHGAAGDAGREAGQPDAHRVRAVAAAAGQRDRHRRLRVGGQLVRPPAADPGRRMRGSLSGTLATMGAAVPYAIGAKFAHPDRPAIAITGDGAMQMNGLAELLTIARYAERWSDPRLVVAVLHNNDLNQVTWELRAMGGTPEVRGVPGAAGRLLRRLRSRPRPGGDHRPRPGRARAGLGAGAGRRPAGRARCVLRPGGAADPAARHLGAGRVGSPGAAQG